MSSSKPFFKFLLLLVCAIAAEHLIHWRGQPLSSHVHSLLGDIQSARPFDQSAVWIKQVSKDAKDGYQRARLGKSPAPKTPDEAPIVSQVAQEEQHTDEISESASSALSSIIRQKKSK